MDNSELDLSEFKELADSLRKKIENLHPLSEKCCIYRIPPRFRQSAESQCEPVAVSIGPFHYGRAEFAAMEGHKIAYLSRFLKRTEVRVEVFLRYIKLKEADLRACYLETINLSSDEFVRMIFLDAVFLIELLLGPAKFFIEIEIIEDMWKLENQLPMFVLEGLFTIARLGLPFSGVIIKKLPLYLIDIRILEKDVIQAHISEAKHFIDFLRLCLRPPDLDNEEELQGTLSIPTITELHQAGVKFELGLNKHLFDIEFSNGILKIPRLDVFIGTETVYRNLLAFEQLYGRTHHLSDYILVISYLVKTRKDVELLKQNGVIKTWIWNIDGETNVFQKLVKETVWIGRDFYYSNLVGQLKAHCSFRPNKWKATLKQNYFNTIWAFISVIAAIVLLIIAFQILCA